MEYGYGAHEYPTSGVFEVEPQNCPGFVFRRSMWLGTTEMSRLEFRVFLEDLAEGYHGDMYHLIFKNCNHFTDDLCKRLTGNRIPRWVNRLAKLGLHLFSPFCLCIYFAYCKFLLSLSMLPFRQVWEGMDGKYQLWKS